MKQLILYIILCFLPLSLFGQLHALSDQHIFNPIIINPAYAGSNDALSANITYRNQWVGFEGAPKTMTASIHSPIGNEKIGLGLTIMNDQIGVNKETSLMVNYAYIIKMGEGRLSFGVSAGVSLLSANWEDLKAITANDMELIDESFKVANPNFSAGMYYRNNDFFFGFSLPMLLSYHYNSSTGELTLKNDIEEYNLFITSGSIFDLSDRVKFYPSVLTKFHPGNALQVDVYSQFIFNEFLWAGMGYRSIDTFVGMLQIQFSNQLRVAYSYDFDIGKTGRYNSGSHEVMLKYVFNISSKVEGPRRF